MGEAFGMPGSTEGKIRTAATARKQLASDARRTNDFVTKYLAQFGQGNAVNNNFVNSLSGYYNGAPIGDIANKLAMTNVFKPRVAPVRGPSQDSLGMLGGIFGEQKPLVELF